MRNIRETVQQKIQGDTGRLVATYLVIIMGLTIIFSSVIYGITSSQFDRPLPSRASQSYQFYSNGRYYDVQDLIDKRAAEARTELIAWLVALNFAVLIGGAFFSYFLARKTLQPIESVMEAQAQFVSDASHELRTPLTALQVTNEVALRKKKLSTAEAKELIEYNLAETIKLRDLSETLLGLAKQDASNTVREQFDVAPVIRSAVESFAPLAKDKSIAINHDVSSIFVMANRPAFEQVVRILLDNALKYSQNNSSITISAKNEASHVVVSVRDQGPGIDQKHQTKIFDRFYRVDESRSSQNIHGNGLGLAIAKSIAVRHGFGLSVNSALGKGAEFIIQVSR